MDCELINLLARNRFGIGDEDSIGHRKEIVAWPIQWQWGDPSNYL